jgi:hypothetical protein
MAGYQPERSTLPSAFQIQFYTIRWPAVENRLHSALLFAPGGAPTPQPASPAPPPAPRSRPCGPGPANSHRACWRGHSAARQWATAGNAVRRGGAEGGGCAKGGSWWGERCRVLCERPCKGTVGPCGQRPGRALFQASAGASTSFQERRP